MLLRSLARSSAVLSVLVSLSLVGGLVASADASLLWKVVSVSDSRLLFAVLVVVLATIPMAVVRLSGVLSAEAGSALGMLDRFRAVMVACVLNSMLPSKGGDLVKIVYLRRASPVASGAAMLLIERCADLLVLGILASVAGVVEHNVWALLVGLGLVALVAVLYSTARFVVVGGQGASALQRKLCEFVGTVHEWGSKPRAVLMTLAGSLGLWLLTATVPWLLLMALGYWLPWWRVCSMFPIAVLAGLVPLTLSGIGTRDVVFTSMLVQYVPHEVGVVVSVGYTVCTYWMLSVLNLPLVFWEVYGWLRARALKEPVC